MYAIWNEGRGNFLIEGYSPILEHEGLDSIWYEQSVFAEDATERIGLTCIEVFDTLDEAQEAKRELEKLTWDKLEILRLKHAWVFNIDHAVKVPQSLKP